MSHEANATLRRVAGWMSGAAAAGLLVCACGSSTASSTTVGGDAPTAAVTATPLPPGTDATPTPGAAETIPPGTAPPAGPPGGGVTTRPPATPTPRPATPTPVPAPAIAAVMAPATAHCTPGTVGMVRISWRVTNATGVDVGIDGPGKFNSTPYPTTAGDDFNFPCDGNPHTYTITTVGGTGPPARRTVTVMP